MPSVTNFVVGGIGLAVGFAGGWLAKTFHVKKKLERFDDVDRQLQETIRQISALTAANRDLQKSVQDEKARRLVDNANYDKQIKELQDRAQGSPPDQHEHSEMHQ